MLNYLSKAQAGAVSALTGVLGAPIAAWLLWTLFRRNDCSPDYFTGSRECLYTSAGQPRSWIELATTPEAVIFAFILAGLVFAVLELLRGVFNSRGVLKSSDPAQ